MTDRYYTLMVCTFFLACALVFSAVAASCAYMHGKCVESGGEYEGNNGSCTKPKGSQ